MTNRWRLSIVGLVAAVAIGTWSSRRAEACLFGSCDAIIIANQVTQTAHMVTQLSKMVDQLQSLDGVLATTTELVTSNDTGMGNIGRLRKVTDAEWLIAAMMIGERLGVGHEPRQRHDVRRLVDQGSRSDSEEICAAAVDAQRISDWLISREREWTVESERPSAEPETRANAMAPVPAREGAPARAGEGSRDPADCPAFLWPRRTAQDRPCCCCR